MNTHRVNIASTPVGVLLASEGIQSQQRGFLSSASEQVDYYLPSSFALRLWAAFIFPKLTFVMLIDWACSL
jgi:hypothetical protein